MALQPKSSNLPEMQPEAIVSAAANASPHLVPGSENAVAQENYENPKDYEEAKLAKPQQDAAEATPKRETKTPKKEEKPVLGQ